MTERRKTQRRRTLKGGRIVFNGGFSSLSCKIRNLSEGGARLEFETVLGVPSEFVLIFDDGSPSKNCVVRWRDATSLGVEFQ